MEHPRIIWYRKSTAKNDPTQKDDAKPSRAESTNGADQTNTGKPVERELDNQASPEIRKDFLDSEPNNKVVQGQSTQSTKSRRKFQKVRIYWDTR